MGTSGSTGDNGLATKAMLNKPKGAATDANGDLYIADTDNHTIRMVDQKNGKITLIAGIPGSPGDNCPDGVEGKTCQLRNPSGLAFDKKGNLYVAVTGNNKVVKREKKTGIMTTVAGTGVSGYDGDGSSATLAKLSSPSAVAFDKKSNMYIVDKDNNNIRMVDKGGNIKSVAILEPSASVSASGIDNYPLNSPSDVALDSDDHIYVADTGNNAVRMFNATTGFFSIVVAGDGTAGASGDGGDPTLAMLNSPNGLAFDTDDNLYIADTGNNKIRVVSAKPPPGRRRILDIYTNFTYIDTYAGTGTAGSSGDGGPATNAELSNPCGVIMNATGGLYIADTDNNEIRLVADKTKPKPKPKPKP